MFAYRDFIDCFIKEMKNNTDTGSPFAGQRGGITHYSVILCNVLSSRKIKNLYNSYSENNLIATLSDMYFAGTDTTSSTLSWMILYMTKFPEIQKKFQDEIEAVTGNNRQCSVNDRPTYEIICFPDFSYYLNLI
jgi:hypothetical protein